jgi:hypothetical protein
MHMNDSNGYDLIILPTGCTTRVFTKEEFRLGANGSVKPKSQPKTQQSRSNHGRVRRS